MAAAAASSGWLRGIVKAVPSGDSLVIMRIPKGEEVPPERSLTLSSLIAPRLARRDGVDEPFAWESREFLRKLCIGKEVTFRVDYALQTGREFGSVFLGDKNLAVLVVSQGWAKVREPSKGGEGQQKSAASPFVEDLLRYEEQAKQQGLGKWSKAPGAADAAIRTLPPSAIGDASNFDAEGLIAEHKGRSIPAIVEQVRDGSTVRVYLLQGFHFVQVFMAGIKSPSMGRRVTVDTVADAEVSTERPNGVAGNGTTSAATRLAASAAAATEIAAEQFGREALYFTERRVLHRDVRIILEGRDKYNNIVASVFYNDGGEAKNLALELVTNGLAKYVEWSANHLEEKDKKALKAAELEAKKQRLRMWMNYVPPASDSKAIYDQNFTGKVVEIVSGDCIIVADDAVPFGNPLAERRVNLSSIRSPTMGNPRIERLPEEYAREAKEFLRQRLMGRQVNVAMEYSRKVTFGDGSGPAPGGADSRVMNFGSVFLASPTKSDGDTATSLSSTAGGQQSGINVAELMVARGFATVVKHRDFEERSNHYDALMEAEAKARNNRKGIHSGKPAPPQHFVDLTIANPPEKNTDKKNTDKNTEKNTKDKKLPKKAKDYLPFLQKKRLTAVVEYVLSGHRFKLLIPKETCSIVFSLSGVRCPAREDPFADEALAFMRRKILQRDVEIEVETVDRTGTFLGSLWESKINMGAVLLQAGLAKLQTSFGLDRVVESHLLVQAQESAKRQKLKIWENFVEGEEVPNGAPVQNNREKEVLKVVVTEVLGGGKFYVQTVGDQMVASIQQQLGSLDIGETPSKGSFQPKKEEVVLAQFSADNSWNRAMIVSSEKDQYEVFYIDYGNQETVPFNRLRPLPASMHSVPALAQLCSLAFVKVPALEEDYGQEAAECLSELTLDSSREFRAMIEERDASGGKVKGQGTGTVLLVTLVDVEAGSSINAAMLKAGLARLEKRKRWDSMERKSAIDNLEEFQEQAKSTHIGMWEYGDIQSDDEDSGPPMRKAAGRR